MVSKNLSISSCPPVEEVPEPPSAQEFRIHISDDVLNRFNELSQDELEFAFGEFTPVQSLNEYMTKLDLCSIQKSEKVSKTDPNGKTYEMFYRPKMFRLEEFRSENIQGTDYFRPLNGNINP